jgi:hypothetical protein
MARTRQAKALEALKFKKCKCGRFAGDTVCQCRIDQVRKDALADKNVQLCLDMAAKREEENTTTEYDGGDIALKN